MERQARDSYLKNPPDSRNFSRRIARIRQKGFHAESRPGEGNELDASAVYLVNPGSDPIIGSRPWGDGTPKWLRDATLNNSDKSFTVPAGKYWDIKAVFNTLVTTATVGNRVLRVRIKEDGTTTDIETVGSPQAASTTVRYVVGFSGSLPTAPSSAAVVATVPSMILPASAVIQVLDTAAIDAAADDLTVVLHYVEYDA